jgi:iron complex transport system permease protein
VDRLRFETFAVVSLMTAAAVALAGPIGFVGLIVPHICRVLVGPDHRRLAIVSGFGGAIFLMLADTCCRVAGQPFGLGGGFPVGVMTALSGGPFFIWLLRRRLKEGGA